MNAQESLSKSVSRGWGDGSVGKSTCASVRTQVQIPRDHIKWSMVGCICNPSTPTTRWEVSTGEPQVLRPAGYYKQLPNNKKHLKQAGM